MSYSLAERYQGGYMSGDPLARVTLALGATLSACLVNASRKNNKKKCASASLTLLLSGLPSLPVNRP